MEQNEISFLVKMNTREIYRFTMYHLYHGYSGMIGITISAIALIVLILKYGTLEPQLKSILILLAAWYILIDPIILYFRARKQARRNKAYQKDLSYKLFEEGITVSQEEISQTVAWDMVAKVVETKKQLIVYTNRVNAFIFPKDCIGENLEAAKQLISQKVTRNNRLKK